MFLNRIEAGRILGERLREYEPEEPVILGLPRGGVPVAAEVARALNAPLDVIVVRKLEAPARPGYALGAIGEGDVRFVDWQVVSDLGVTARQLERAIRTERLELEHRARRLRAANGRLDIRNRSVIIVDDGMVTGATVTAAVRVARDLGARRIVVAAPVAPAEIVRLLERISDAVLVLESPDQFSAVGEAYVDFRRIDDKEVLSILHQMRAATASFPVDRSRSA